MRAMMAKNEGTSACCVAAYTYHHRWWVSLVACHRAYARGWRGADPAIDHPSPLTRARTSVEMGDPGVKTRRDS